MFQDNAVHVDIDIDVEDLTFRGKGVCLEFAF